MHARSQYRIVALLQLKVCAALGGMLPSAFALVALVVLTHGSTSTSTSERRVRGVWEEKGPMPVGRTLFSAVVLESVQGGGGPLILVAGGAGSSLVPSPCGPVQPPLASANLFDVQQKQWMAAAALPSPR